MLSKKSRENLKKAAERARGRIRSAIKKSIPGMQIPSPTDYTLAALEKRIENGEHINRIYNELKKLTAANFRKEAVHGYTIKDGTTLTANEVRQLSARIEKANREIAAAQKKYNAGEVLPSPFDINQVFNTLINKRQYNEVLKDLQLFRRKDLQPTAINAAGVAGTKAEYEYRKRIIDRENERRARVREETAPGKVQGFLRMQADVDNQEIDISKYDMNQLRKKSETWNTGTRIIRANQYIENYKHALQNYHLLMLSEGKLDNVARSKFDYILKALNKLYYDEEKIRLASTTVPNIDINIFYPGNSEEIDFDEIVEAWMDFTAAQSIDMSV